MARDTLLPKSLVTDLYPKLLTYALLGMWAPSAVALALLGSVRSVWPTLWATLVLLDMSSSTAVS